MRFIYATLYLEGGIQTILYQPFFTSLHWHKISYIFLHPCILSHLAGERQKDPQIIFKNFCVYSFYNLKLQTTYLIQYFPGFLI